MMPTSGARSRGSAGRVFCILSEIFELLLARESMAADSSSLYAGCAGVCVQPGKVLLLGGVADLYCCVRKGADMLVVARKFTSCIN